MNNLILTEEQMIAITEHAEAFAQYLIVGQYKGVNEMRLYYDIVAKYWNKCHILRCDSRTVGIDGLMFGESLQSYIDTFKRSGYL